MSVTRKVVWSEGMFLQPHHFQQHDRYLEGLVEARAGHLRPSPWGFWDLTLDVGLLAIGKLGLATARGILPDGTAFAVPDQDDGPTPLEVPDEVKNTTVYLAVPTRQGGMVETDASDDRSSLARYAVAETEVRDSNAGSESRAPVQVGRLRLRLLLEGPELAAHSHVGVARVVEKRADKQVVLDEAFIPPCLDLRASPRLAGFVSEIAGLLHHRGEELAGRMGGPGRGGVSEVADFLLLQAVNRAEPVFRHLDGLADLHPEDLYRGALALAGELATFTAPRRRPPELPVYAHHALKETFAPLMAEIRRSLSMVLEQNAIPIPLQETKFGIRVAAVADRLLFRTAVFVLAVNAQVPAETIRARFPSQTKVGPVEKIRDLVNLALPGIGLRPLPVAPRQIPYHAGFNYFELDRSSELWKALETSSGCAIHVAGDYPALELELWAIRG
jgi:type VI secretion system protein ImpJ